MAGPGRDLSRNLPEGLEDARRLAGLFTSFDHSRRILEQRATLGLADMRLLWLLADNEPRTLKQISEELGLEQSTVNRQVNVAMRDGLLERDRKGAGGAYLFTASKKGARKFDQNLSAMLGSYRSAFEALGDKGQPFMELLAEYVEAYRRAVRGEEA
jgi:DNA-binding MarR family transcriptional regulator